jgi:hypothetical protein
MAYWIALIYVGLDEMDLAFDWLEKAYQENPLHSDVRFKKHLDRLKLPL